MKIRSGFYKTVSYIILFAAALPSNWTDMNGGLLKVFPLTAGSQEYNDVERELNQTGLAANIISVCSISDRHQQAFSPARGCVGVGMWFQVQVR